MRRPLPYLREAGIAIVAAIGLTACGPGGEVGGAEEGSGGMTAQLRVACTSQIENIGVPAGAVDQVCECASRRAQDQLSVTDIIAGETSALQEIVTQCVDESLGFGGAQANTNGTES